MKHRFECPRCGHVHSGETNELTHAKYPSAQGTIETCTFKLQPEREGNMLVTFFKMVEETPWKIRSNRIRVESAA